MTNGSPEAVAGTLQPANGVNSWNGQIQDPIPVFEFVSVGLWLLTFITILSVLFKGLARRRRSDSTAALSRKASFMSTILLFIGGGIGLWTIGTDLMDYVVLADKVRAELVSTFLLLNVGHHLHFLAITVILSGIGFVVAQWLKDKDPQPPGDVDPEQQQNRN